MDGVSMAVVTGEVKRAMPETGQQESVQTVTGAAAWLTVERLAYIAALCIGAFYRFWALGAMPLLPIEAASSWPAYLAAQGQSVADASVPTSALFYGWQWLLFWIGVDGDAGARVVSAAVSTLLILLPWAWRGWIGRGVALGLAWLIAFDPWLIAFGRLADGAGLGIVLGMVTLTAMMRLVEDDTPREQGFWRRVAALAGGLLLVSGVLAWSWLPVLAIFAYLHRSALRSSGLFTWQTGAWAGLAAVLGATFVLARLDGVALVGSSLSAWLDQWRGPGEYGFGWPWVRLVVDIPLVAVMGAAGLVTLNLRRGPEAEQGSQAWPAFLALWLGWGVALCLLPGRGPWVLPMVGLPLLFGAATRLADLVARRPSDLEWREVGAIGATLAILLISGSFWAAAFISNRVFDAVMAQATVVIFGLALAVLVVYGVWANRRHALWTALLALAIVLGAATVRSGWQLNQIHTPGKANGFYARTTHPEVRLLVRDIETLSAHRTGTPHQLPVMVEMGGYQAASGEPMEAQPDPVLGWYLRAMRDVVWRPAPSPTEPSGIASTAAPLPVIIRHASQPQASGGSDEEGTVLPDGYIGSAYQIEAFWLPRLLTGAGPVAATDATQPRMAQQWTPRLQPIARWVVYRAVPVAPATRDVVLWAIPETD